LLVGGWARLGNRLRRRVVAELVGGKLAVERRHVLGAGGVPLDRQIVLALVLGRAAAPIGGSGLGVGLVDPGEDLGEMVERDLRLLQVAQRDIAGEEFGLGIGAAVGQPVLLDDLIGKLGLAAGEQAPGDALALAPPREGPLRVVGVGNEDLRGVVILVLLAVPAHLVKDEAGAELQARRHLGHRGGGVL